MGQPLQDLQTLRVPPVVLGLVALRGGGGGPGAATRPWHCDAPPWAGPAGWLLPPPDPTSSAAGGAPGCAWWPLRWAGWGSWLVPRLAALAADVAVALLLRRLAQRHLATDDLRARAARAAVWLRRDDLAAAAGEAGAEAGPAGAPPEAAANAAALGLTPSEPSAVSGFGGSDEEDDGGPDPFGDPAELRPGSLPEVVRLETPGGPTL